MTYFGLGKGVHPTNMLGLNLIKTNLQYFHVVYGILSNEKQNKNQEYIIFCNV